jgi:hypothetical protein
LDIHEMPGSYLSQNVLDGSVIFLTTYGLNHTLKYAIASFPLM